MERFCKVHYPGFFSTSVSEKFGFCRPAKLFESSSGLRSSTWGLFALVTYVVQSMLTWDGGILLSVSPEASNLANHN